MFLSWVQITNFRNFHSLEVNLGQTSVIVGENNVGKSNFLYALRLILDPRLPDSARQLREEDFWDGLKQPVKNKQMIEVSVEFQDFAKDKNLLSILQEFLVKGASPDTARLTYRFRPRVPLPTDRDLTDGDYEFVVFGGTQEKNRVTYEVRRWIPIEVLPALRDAESDLSAWRDSPLRPLIERLNISETTLTSVANEIDQATEKLTSEKDIQTLKSDIDSRLANMIGNVIKIDPSLGFTPTNPERLARALRMFGDGSRKRPIGDLSLGINNVLYLLLLALELERKEASSERATTILAIEEPEAHLHTHLQRLVFRDFLRRESPVILTTHSPHIASVAPLPSLVLLRKDKSGATIGHSAFGAELGEQEVADIERYLDATRAEILFARGVVLVEGPAEMFLVPAFSAAMGYPLDEYGVTVCSVHGTDFVPYAKLLGPRALSVPFTVMTDGDWYRSVSKETLSRGYRRGISVVTMIDPKAAEPLEEVFKARDWDTLAENLAASGIFVGGRTLELDLLDAGYGPEISTTMEELGVSKRILDPLRPAMVSADNMTTEAEQKIMQEIERLGKGRFAQRLAGKADASRCPSYITEAVNRIVQVLTS